MVGDLLHGRTVHSLARLLSIYPDVTIYYVSPDALAMPKEVFDDVKERGVKQERVASLEAALALNCDVVYMTRMQKERFADMAEYDKCR